MDREISISNVRAVFKDVRKERYKSINDVMRAGCPISASCISAIERDRNLPSLFSAITLLNFYGKTLYVKDEKMKIGISLEPGAVLPTKAHDTDAGYDLYCPERGHYVTTGHPAIIDTGVHMNIPEGYCGLIVSKSGLNIKKDITCTGLIDAGYTGTIVVKLSKDPNLKTSASGIPYEIEQGDKIAQIIILPVPNVELVLEQMPETERGANGFGSTGK